MSATNAAISARILTAIGNGATVRDALDNVLGAGTYARVVGELYDELRERANVNQIMELLRVANIQVLPHTRCETHPTQP